MSDEMEQQLEVMVQRRLEDPEYDPIREWDGDSDMPTPLRTRWERLVEGGFLETAPETWFEASFLNEPLYSAEEEPTEYLREYAGRYRCTESIGRGGMGEVLRAVDTELGRVVAVKVLRYTAADGAAVRAFMEEARRTGALEHPSIVPVYDVGLDLSRELFIVMKLVEGQSLAEVLQAAGKSLPLPPRELVRVIRSAAEAVSFAHQRGIIHRDIKPGNIMLGQHGEVMMVDWGIARPDDVLVDLDEDSSDADGRDRVSGTPGYMPPEQALGQVAREGPTTDVFGLGATLFHLLTGGAPYRGNREEVLERARSGQRSPIARPDWQRSAPRELVGIAYKAMSISPDDRYTSADEFLEDLDAYEDGRRGLGWSDGPILKAKKWVAHHPVATLAAVLVLTTVTLGLALGSFRALAKVRGEAASRSEWLSASRSVLDDPRRGLSSGDAYHEASRRLMALLGVQGLDISDSQTFRKRLERLETEDSEVADRSSELLHELGLTLARSGLLSPAPGLGKETLARIASIKARTEELDPELLDMWDEYAATRAAVARDEWERDLFAATVAITEQGSGAARELLGRLFQGADDRAESDARALVRLASFGGIAIFDRDIRSLSEKFPSMGPAYQALSGSEIGKSLYRTRQGAETGERRIRAALEAEANARAALAVIVQREEARRHLVLMRGHVIEAFYAAARESEARGASLDQVTEPNAVGVRSALLSTASGYRTAGVSWRARQLDGALITVRLRPDEWLPRSTACAVLASSLADLQNEVPVQGRERLIAQWARSGFSVERITSEIEKQVTWIERNAIHIPEAVSNAVDALKVAGDNERAEALSAL